MSSLLISIVIPTYNEHENISVLLAQLTTLLAPISSAYEIIVVDDASPDNTAEIVRNFSVINKTVRLISRSDQRDLSTALAAGFDNAKGEYLLAMDADLQHDPALVMSMLDIARKNDVDLVVATRYADGGGPVDWGRARLLLSGIATRMVLCVLGSAISDPLSGCFLMRRESWREMRPRLNPAGFKLLLEIISAAPDLRYAEVGYQFIGRQRGSSKLDAAVVFAFLSSLLRCSWRRFTGLRR